MENVKLKSDEIQVNPFARFAELIWNLASSQVFRTC